MSVCEGQVWHAQVSLYSQERDERELLGYLQGAKDLLGRPLYDAQFALRVARQAGHLHACVQLLCELNLHEARLGPCFTVAFTVASGQLVETPGEPALLSACPLCRCD